MKFKVIKVRRCCEIDILEKIVLKSERIVAVHGKSNEQINDGDKTFDANNIIFSLKIQVLSILFLIVK